MILDEILALIETHKSSNGALSLVEIQLGREPMSVIANEIKEVFGIEADKSKGFFFLNCGVNITLHQSFDEVHFIFNLPHAKKAFGNFQKNMI